MKSCQPFSLALLMVILTGSIAIADTGIPWVGSITVETSAEASFLILPDGSGPPLTRAMLFGGQTVDGRLTVRLIDVSGIPIPGFPAEDIWLEAESSTDAPCLALGAFRADDPTNANGETSFVAPLAGGGWSKGPVWVYLNGMRATHPQEGELPPVARRFNSPDISGDGSVNLSDVATFTVDLYGVDRYRSDFQWDGVVNLSDVVIMASSLGQNCP